MRTRAAIAIGSNQGDRDAHIAFAAQAIGALPGTSVLALSASREYPALRVGDVDPGGPYLNAALTIETASDALDLLEQLQSIERDAGRDRTQPRGSPRPLDLDLILLGECMVCDPRLVVPHPALRARRFVLEPLAEIAGDWPVPGTGTNVRGLLARLDAPPRGGGMPLTTARPPLSTPPALLIALALAAALGAMPNPPALAEPHREPPKAKPTGPVEVPVEQAWAEIRKGYQSGVSAERIAITIRAERGSRRDEIGLTLRPSVTTPATADQPATTTQAGVALELGSLRVWLDGGTLRVIDNRASDTIFEQHSDDPAAADQLLAAIPPLPLPQVRWVLGQAWDPGRPLGSLGEAVSWTEAKLNPEANPPTLSITGSGIGGVTASVLADARTGRLRRLLLPIAEGVVMEWQVAPETVSESAFKPPDPQGRRRVDSVAALRSRPASSEPTPPSDQPKPADDPQE
jgi:2-amino-4-hydroxy-6-hydroxymethyldihydropteridine diphosphokinase